MRNIDEKIWTDAQDAHTDIKRCMFDVGFIAPENAETYNRLQKRVARNLNAIALAFEIIKPGDKS